jgi:hypothetical protein
MTDERTVKLQAALRAQTALVFDAQAEIARYLAKEFKQPDLVDRLIRLFDGPEQREAQRLAHEALREDFGNNA